MKKLSYYIMLLGIVFFTSCEDFLDQVPKHNLTLDNAVTDYSGAKNRFLTGCTLSWLPVQSSEGLPGVGCLHRVDFTRLTRLISICPIKRGPMI